MSGFFSDAWNSISSAFSSNDTQNPAPISSAVGELTPAGQAMGGQEAVDASMTRDDSTWGSIKNFLHTSPTTGDLSDNDEYKQAFQNITKSNQEQQQRQQQQQQELLNSSDGSRSFLPKIESGGVQQDPMLQSQIKPIQISSGGPFTGALNNIQQTFQS